MIHFSIHIHEPAIELGPSSEKIISKKKGDFG